MEIVGFNVYRDGGTIEIKTKCGTTLYIGSRINNSEDKIYYQYTNYDNRNNHLVDNCDQVLREIVIGLSNYKNDFYQTSIDHFVERHKSIIRDNALNKLI